MLTVQLHKELKETSMKVNSVSPGFVATELAGFGVMPPEEGVRLLVQYALGGENRGRFVEPDGVTP